MRNRFKELWRRIGASVEAEGVFCFVSDSYSQPHRFYHNLDHIHCCLKEFSTVRSLASNPECVEMALWFHDIIYDVHQTDNEKQSAETAFQVCLNAGLSKVTADTVRTLVLATKHTSQPTSPDEQLITDVDLAILGKPSEIYDMYESNIQREYSFFSDEDYRKGRTAVLRNFLNKPCIYATDYFITKYQQQAVDNLQRAILRLEES